MTDRPQSPGDPAPAARRSLRCPVLHLGARGARADSRELIGEEPLLFRIEGSDYAAVMRTPGEEIAHAAGFCLAEGIVETAGDFAGIGFCADLDPNVVEIRLQPACAARVAPLLERRGFLSQTSCGICGKQMIEELIQRIEPLPPEPLPASAVLQEAVRALLTSQQFYRRTRGSHAALVADREGRGLAFAEDVGRHNAVDKAVGRLLLERRLPEASVLVLSSRLSYELVQKAARARLAVVVSLSRPTALAVEMARRLHLGLLCAEGENGFLVFSGEDRLAG